MLAGYKILTPLSHLAIAGPSSQNLFVILASLVSGIAVYLFCAKLFNLEQWQLIRSNTHSTTK